MLALPDAVKREGTKGTKRLAMVRQTETAANLTATAAPRFRGFLRPVGRAGYVEDQNLAIFRFSGDEGSDKYASLAHEVLSAAPDVIFIAGGNVARAFKPLVPTTPIVALSN